MPRPATTADRAADGFAAAAIAVAAGLTYATWREAVHWRATSGDGHIVAWAMPSTAVAAVLLLWLITAVLDRGRNQAVALLATALVVVPVAGWWAVVAATSDMTVGL